MSRLLDGIDDYLSITHNASLQASSEISYAAWVYARSFAQAAPYIRGIMSKYHVGGSAQQGVLRLGNGLVGDVDNPYFIVIIGGAEKTAAGATNLSTLTWYHICGTYDGTTVRIYVNAVQDGATAASGALSTGTSQFAIGTDYIPDLGTFDREWNGFIAHAHAYNVALTIREIGQIMRFPGSVRRGMMGYWPLWGNTTPEPDFSGFKNNLTLNGSVGAGNTPPVGKHFIFNRPRSEYRLPAPAGGGSAFTQDITQAITVTETISKDTLKHLTETITLTEVITKIVEKHLSQHTTITEAITKEPTKHLTQHTTLTEAISKDTTKHLSDNFTITEALSKECMKHLSQNMTITEAITKEPQKHINEVVTLTESISKDILKHLSQHITITESVAASIVGQVLPILVRFLLKGNIETHDKISMESDLIGTGIIKQDDREMENDQDRLNWDWHTQ